jgi:oxygen-independent coproporphyrinogen-3 oxidase
MNKQFDRYYIDSLYLHFPFCAHLCNYCDFFKRVSKDKAYDYEMFHQYLEKSFLLHESLMKEHGYSWVPLRTFYIGGGTPSLWGQEGKLFLENFFHKHKLALDSDCEFTLEVNPGAWTDDSLSAWRSFGANRFSLGVQSLDKEMIRYLDRVHSIEQVYETLEYFSHHQLNFSMDFMLGLPFSRENRRDVIAELTEALKYNPSHFSVYILTVKDNYPHYKDLPNEEWIAEEYLAVAEFLKSHGFVHYEVSNFAKAGKQSIHNLNYWKTKTVAAFGPSATGFLNEVLLRYKWKTNNPEFEMEQLTHDESRLEKIYMAIRSEEGINISDFSSSIEVVAVSWEKKGLANIEGGVVTLTSKGFLLLDSLMDELFTQKLL